MTQPSGIFGLFRAVFDALDFAHRGIKSAIIFDGHAWTGLDAEHTMSNPSVVTVERTDDDTLTARFSDLLGDSERDELTTQMKAQAQKFAVSITFE